MKSRFRLALAGLAAAAALAAPEEAASAAEAPRGSWHVVYTQAGSLARLRELVARKSPAAASCGSVPREPGTDAFSLSALTRRLLATPNYLR